MIIQVNLQAKWGHNFSLWRKKVLGITAVPSLSVGHFCKNPWQGQEFRMCLVSWNTLKWRYHGFETGFVSHVHSAGWFCPFLLCPNTLPSTVCNSGQGRGELGVSCGAPQWPIRVTPCSSQRSSQEKAQQSWGRGQSLWYVVFQVSLTSVLKNPFSSFFFQNFVMVACK